MATVFAVDTSPSGFPGGAEHVPVTSRILVEIAATMDARAIANAIMRAVGNQRIDRLHLAAHGNSGQLFMGLGLGADNAQVFSCLRGKFSVNLFGVGVYVMGCAVASANEVQLTSQNTSFGATAGWSGAGLGFGTNGLNDNDLYVSRLRSTRGYRFLRALASAMGTGVKAAYNAQDVNRIPYIGWEIDGASLTVWPNGQARIHDPSQNIGMGAMTDNPAREFRF